MNNTYYEIPAKIRAGDYYELLLSYSDYDTSEGYSPNLYIRGVSTLDVNGSISGDYYRFEITSDQSGVLQAGTYQFAVTVKLGGKRTTVSTGWLTVEDNLATTGVKISHAETMVKAIEAVLEGRVTDDIASLSIAGRSITKLPIEQLMNLRANYMKELHILKNGPSVVRKTVPIVFGKITG